MSNSIIDLEIAYDQTKSFSSELKVFIYDSNCFECQTNISSCKLKVKKNIKFLINNTKDVWFFFESILIS